MNRRSDPGFSQWLITFLLIGLGIFLIYRLIQYSGQRANLPTGMTIAGIEVEGYNLDEARQILTDRYINAPIVIYHGDQRVEIDPQRDAEFVLDYETMLVQAQEIRDRQDFWSGFWGFLWGVPIEVDMVELRATHNRQALQDTIQQIASQYDEPAQPPQPAPTTLSFLYGEMGRETNIAASLPDIEAALYRPTSREAFLNVVPVEAPRPNMNLLLNLIVNHLETFPGVASVFIQDLETGDEISINADVAMSGMSIMKIPIVVDVMRILEEPIGPQQTALISDTIIATENESANQLLTIIAGENDVYLGADLVTQSIQRLGLNNTFLLTPYDQLARDRVPVPETAANTRTDVFANPDPAMQTTAEDIGSLLSELYYCDQYGGGALIAAYEGQITQAECRLILDTMATNFIGTLIEEGVPGDVAVAHRHGWIGDTHGDAGIVFTPQGDYVIVMFLHQPGFLQWVDSSPLMADISRATYNYFNFDTPYFGSQQSSN